MKLSVSADEIMLLIIGRDKTTHPNWVRISLSGCFAAVKLYHRGETIWIDVLLLPSKQGKYLGNHMCNGWPHINKHLVIPQKCWTNLTLSPLTSKLVFIPIAYTSHLPTPATWCCKWFIIQQINKPYSVYKNLFYL